ncbi:folylpolyglutamate synthetase [Spathaspora passalidarum NRRL Y-27907]|uniref:Folylpolyglutamate synthase n=1 Tax=Spathaspora passalidarum (strain NRRL Y-27907 / 11-Y1) TaxID=619300 RepID=G3ALB0_SPAPN|nr:folylpolyglutamate synthetase [Spathaspora passalidarum NRRL Y-27907]EGW33153.1 folylpolyglutamate synthetase [Spathaspora passalidarum NRRL Y-27907]
MSEANEQDSASAMRTPRTYKDAINCLNSLQSNFASIEAMKKLGPNVNRNELSINEVFEFTRRLGYKASDFNKLNIIHVTGTKGKGSTCAFTESILKQYQPNYISKIGLYTSPHLKSVRERIRINGQPINEDKFAKYFFEVWDKLSSTTSDPIQWPTLQPSDQVKPMYFKYLTVLSFHVFLQEGIDTAIYEVGVGGTYDSTNIIDKPTVTGISALGIDHTFMLGNTIESITENKTGIFKNGSPAYVSKQVEYPETHELIKSRAKELRASSLEFVGPDLPSGIKLGLSGDFQRANAALAVRLANSHLKTIGIDKDLPQFNEDGSIKQLSDKFISGLANVDWPGRCQVIRNREGYENITWYIDGAHTIESINASSTWFKQEQSKNITGKRRVLLFNQQGRDNYKELLAKLYQVVSESDPSIVFSDVIFTPNVTWASGEYNAELLSKNTSEDAVKKLEIQHDFSDQWKELDGDKANRHVFPDIETSINYLKSESEKEQLEVFVCGSLHLVGGFLVVLDNDRD